MLKEGERISVVTGAKQGGIGFETARLLAPYGVVYLTAHKESDAIESARVLEQEGFSIEARQLDVTNQSEIDQLVQNAKDRYGNINTLVNSAVIFPNEDRGKKITKVPINSVLDNFSVNTLGSLRMIQAVIPGMEEDEFGRIVQIFGSWGSASRAYDELMGKGGGYGISKAAETYLVASVAADLKGRGFDKVTINTVDPGKVRTVMNPGGMRESSDAAIDVARVALFPKGSNTTGQLFRDGKIVPYDSYTPKD